MAVRQAYLILISTFLKNFANLSHHMTTVKLLDQLLVCLLVEVDADIVQLVVSLGFSSSSKINIADRFT